MRFEELDVWKRSARLSADIYKYFAQSRDFGFRDQITRSGLSVPCNIAEGYERSSTKDRARFWSYAKGSAGELRTQIYIAREIGYLDPETAAQWLREVQAVSRMIQSLITGIKHE
ncbi:four helix bundle protein [Alcanivorax sp. N3-2A]|nr:four helix bundle protein [Alcanivorax sp. N3-2A]